MPNHKGNSWLKQYELIIIVIIIIIIFISIFIIDGSYFAVKFHLLIRQWQCLLPYIYNYYCIVYVYRNVSKSALLLDPDE